MDFSKHLMYLDICQSVNIISFILILVGIALGNPILSSIFLLIQIIDLFIVWKFL